MATTQTWKAQIYNSEDEVIATISHEVEFRKDALNEFMDLLDYAYFASAEIPLLSMPADHKIVITTS